MNAFNRTAVLFVLLLGLAIFSTCGDKAVEWSVDLGPDSRLPDNETLTLDASNQGATYLWSTGATSQSIEVDSSGLFWVQVSLNGDTQSDTILVERVWRTVKVESSMGNMHLWLHPETPLHKEGFLKLVNQGYFNDQTFNRVINQFVIQGGCPDLEGGFTDTSLFVAPEFRPHLRHKYGALGGGRDDNPGKKTNICQFYIVDKQNGPYDVKRLDGSYTIFGMVIDGLEVVQEISKVDTDDIDTPLEDVTMHLSEEQYSAAELLSLFQFEM